MVSLSFSSFVVGFPNGTDAPAPKNKAIFNFDRMLCRQYNYDLDYDLLISHKLLIFFFFKNGKIKDPSMTIIPIITIAHPIFVISGFVPNSPTTAKPPPITINAKTPLTMILISILIFNTMTHYNSNICSLLKSGDYFRKSGSMGYKNPTVYIPPTFKISKK